MFKSRSIKLITILCFFILVTFLEANSPTSCWGENTSWGQYIVYQGLEGLFNYDYINKITDPSSLWESSQIYNYMYNSNFPDIFQQVYTPYDLLTYGDNSYNDKYYNNYFDFFNIYDYSGYVPFNYGLMNTSFFYPFSTTTKSSEEKWLGISLEEHCKWQCLGKANRDYHINHKDGDGLMEIYEGTSNLEPPNTETATKLRPDLKKGQGTVIDSTECWNDRYIWVHAKKTGAEGSIGKVEGEFK